MTSGTSTTQPLDGTSGVITGGGSGIGLESARLLRRDGCAVTLFGRTEDRLRESVAALNADSSTAPTATYIVGDAANEASVQDLVGQVVDQHGGLDFAVASAGRGGLGPIAATPVEEWNDIMATNLTGTFLLFKHAGLAMAKSGGGAMVAISSIAAAVTHPYMGPYCVSKAAIDALVRQVADELGRANVRVNSVRPGIVDTDLVSMIMDDDGVMDSYFNNMAVSRVGNVDDIAAGVRYLLGPESSWVTGTSLSIDGGHHLRRGPDFEAAAEAFFPGMVNPHLSET